MRFRSALIRAASALLLLTAADNGAAADVFKWVDEQGNVHFGDRPQGSDAQALTVRPAAVPASGGRARHERTERLLESLKSEREERRDAYAAAERDKAERKRKCAVARAELNRRETSAHLFYRDAEGNKRIIEGEEYDAAIAEAREAVDHWCGGR